MQPELGAEVSDRSARCPGTRWYALSRVSLIAVVRSQHVVVITQVCGIARGPHETLLFYEAKNHRRAVPDVVP